MVQLLTDPTLSPSGTPALETVVDGLRQEGKVMSREEHAQRMKELNLKRGMMRTPRRGWSLTDHQNQHDGSHHFHVALPPADRQASIPENAVLPSSSIPTPTPTVTPSQPVEEQTAQIPRRPKLPPPRRSYSATDKEPEPTTQHQPSARMTLLDLPSELHYTLFDFLDPIDGACLGLTHSRLYTIHRRKNGTVPLSSRYSGPNDREWAWRGAGPLIHPESGMSTAASGLGQMRVKGQMYCRKCGVSRCELHRHLKGWVGEKLEYCEIKELYGRPAGPDAKAYCFMSSPKNPHRCGRHGGKRSA